MPFFWCTDHHSVEDEHGCRGEVRLGPYPTREAAQHALQSVKERNDELDAEDEAWRSGD
jgi:hypothetical protein